MAMEWGVSKLPGSDPDIPHAVMKRPSLRELYHTVVGPFPIRDEDLAVWGDSDIAWPIERVGALPRDTGGAQRHQDFTFRTELQDDGAHLARNNHDIGDPDVPFVVHSEAVRPAHQSHTETTQGKTLNRSS